MLQIILLIIMILMIVILYKIHSLNKHINWLKELFIYRSPYNGYENIINIPQEISLLKTQLAPLFYLPLGDVARKLTNLTTIVNEEFHRKCKFLTQVKFSEMEKFAQSGSPSKPFPASDSLKHTLKEWAVACHNCGRVNQWREKYKQAFIGVISGNLTIEQAEKSLGEIHEMSLVVNKDESHVNELYNSEAEKWQAERWFEEFKLLKDEVYKNG